MAVTVVSWASDALGAVVALPRYYSGGNLTALLLRSVVVLPRYHSGRTGLGSAVPLPYPSITVVGLD